MSSLNLKLSLFTQVSSSSTPILGHVGNNEAEKSEIPSDNLNPLVIHPHDENMVTNTEGNQGYFGDEENNMSLIVDKEENNGKNVSLKRGHWAPTEDAKLKEHVAEFGPCCWNEVAKHLPGRSGKNCRSRWCNQLDPNIKNSPFSVEEENILLDAYKIHGAKWSVIRNSLPGRTDNAIKNQYHRIITRNKKQESSSTVSRKRKSPLIKNTIDESNSTCTELSLATRPLLNNQTYGSQMGLLIGQRNAEAGKFGHDNIFNAMKSSSVDHMKRLKSVDQCNYSNSASEVSTSESVQTNKINVFGLDLEESENVITIDRTKVNFFDFLGLGDK